MKVYVYYPFHDITTGIATTDRANLFRIIREVIRPDIISGMNVLTNNRPIGQILEQEVNDGTTHVYISEHARLIFSTEGEMWKHFESPGHWDGIAIVGV